MQKTKSFSDDWSNLTDDEIMKNIRYLTKNYGRYETNVYGNGTMRIGNVHFVLFSLSQHGKQQRIAKVNNKKIFECINYDLYNAINNLYETCQRGDVPFMVKLADVWQETKMMAVACAIITFVIGGGLAMVVQIDKRQKQKKEQMVRKALEEYKKAQKTGKTVVIDDIVKQVVR